MTAAAPRYPRPPPPPPAPRSAPRPRRPPRGGRPHGHAAALCSCLRHRGVRTEDAGTCRHRHWHCLAGVPGLLCQPPLSSTPAGCPPPLVLHPIGVLSPTSQLPSPLLFHRPAPTPLPILPRFFLPPPGCPRIARHHATPADAAPPRGPVSKVVGGRGQGRLGAPPDHPQRPRRGDAHLHRLPRRRAPHPRRRHLRRRRNA